MSRLDGQKKVYKLKKIYTKVYKFKPNMFCLKLFVQSPPCGLVVKRQEYVLKVLGSNIDTTHLLQDILFNSLVLTWNRSIETSNDGVHQNYLFKHKTKHDLKNVGGQTPFKSYTTGQWPWSQGPLYKDNSTIFCCNLTILVGLYL